MQETRKHNVIVVELISYNIHVIICFFIMLKMQTELNIYTKMTPLLPTKKGGKEGHRVYYPNYF
jgi:hypothetical protein